MLETVFDFVWQDIVRRQFASADAIDKARYPEIHRQALNQVAEFGRLPIPESGHELNLRRVSAYSMMMNWQSEMSCSLSSHSQ